jgi:PhnB protein
MVKTGYSSCFVSLVDRYGIRWELMTEQTER